ncbi:helix-turn-helix transcriptional regulator [Goodfellowiella coeruleoviolacea]|uniref:DNA-binding transcriptional regulator YafY, contains an HTH and WYL domains n=1 Tax=Goodfellowiella coeruleoviolacea TaxID=334858 RepID=A0AAE3KK22_9PSEU|nr:YafY family protein [Goodfellowiella coeruleoviolacea]MCP2168919.1 putative DNA-binding transcriptional regulator YafY, contains an HTH and WYL domains [Goodfellowiella coeruleoviolacea]
MRASRLVSLLLLLQTRGRMTAQELADELEVSVRTVYRDVESLSAAGVPVYADRGPAGGYQLLAGYRTRLTGLTSGEAESLVFTGMPEAAAELGIGEVLAAAELKLLAALPPELRSRTQRIRDCFLLDAPGWFREADQTPHLAAVADAVWNQQVIRVRYRRWTAPREVDRVLRPLGVVLKAGVWYLIAQSREQIRTYRVATILDLEALGEHFDRPEGFDLAQFWRSWVERFERDIYRGEAVVRLSPVAIERMSFLLGPVLAKAALANAERPDQDGWVRTVLPIESIRHAHADLLKLGAEVEVLEPAELRARFTDTAHALARLYPADQAC